MSVTPTGAGAERDTALLAALKADVSDGSKPPRDMLGEFRERWGQL